MNKNRLYSFLTILIISIGLVGCGGGDDENNSHVVSGKISDYSTALGIAGVEVSANGHSVTTTTDGRYALSGLSDGKIIVNIKGDGYATTSEIVNIETDEDSNVSLNVNMLPVAFRGMFNANQSFTAQVPSSPANVAISAGSLKLSDGTAPSGDITAELTPINPALDIDLMPGEMIVSGGNSIASYGAMTVEFKDANGAELNLGSGETATIRIPVSSRGGTTPNTIPLYFYDKVEGVWKEEGTATLSADRTYYEGQVSHFSTWNADYLYDSVTIKGCVEDINGSRLSNVNIDMIGQNYNGATSSISNASGEFTISAMQNATSLITAYTDRQVSNTISIPAQSSEVIVDDCLVLSNTPLTVRLRWGEHPSDLDTHVIGPNNYHIWFRDLGTYAINGAKLDVDDTSSYGPEVFTAMNFSEAGVYHYSVYHYLGSSSITDSPARVELTLNGDISVFTPPSGQTTLDKWWNVFDIIVDENGNITIRRVNTWATDSTGLTRNHKITKK